VQEQENMLLRRAGQQVAAELLQPVDKLLIALEYLLQELAPANGA
jgi:hypothetical protein